MKQYLVFDWGGTEIKYALMDEEASILEQNRIPTVPRTASKEQFMEALDGIFDQYRDRISGVAISSPGILDSTLGIIHAVGVFPYLNECRIREELEERWNLPVSLENDGKAAALAELWRGSLKGLESGAVLTIGTGIGGGLVLDGKLRRGPDFFAGEFSEVCTNIYDPSNKENYWSMLGTKGLIQRFAEKYGTDPAGLNGIAVFEKINAGEEKALEALNEYTDLLAMTVFNLNIVLNLQKISIGGGISRQPALIDSLRQSVKRIETVHPDILGGTPLPMPEVTVCQFFNEANLIGALYHLLHE